MDTLVLFNSNQTLDIALGTVLSGQLIRFGFLTTLFTVNAFWAYEMGNYLSLIKTESLEFIFETFSEHVDGYVALLDIAFGDEESGGTHYNSFNDLMLDSRLLIPAMTEDHLQLCAKFGIPQVVVHPTETFNKHVIIFQNPKWSSGLMDMAFAHQAKLVWNPWTFGKFEHLIPPFDVYGFAGSLGFIPMEGPTVREISRQGGYLFVSDSYVGLPVYRQLDSVIGSIKPKPIKRVLDIDSESHLIAFVMSDGDNFNVVSNNVEDMLKPKSFPVTWTVAVTVPKLVLNYIYNNVLSEIDSVIAGPSGYGYSFPNLVKYQHDYRDKTHEAMNDVGLTILNQIHFSIAGFLSFLQETVMSYSFWSPFPHVVEIPGVKAILSYDYFSYDLGKGKFSFSDDGNTVPYLSATQKLYFDYDKNMLLTSRFEKGGFSIVPVNMWGYTIEDLSEIVETLREKHEFIKFVTLEQLIDDRILNL